MNQPKTNRSNFELWRIVLIYLAIAGVFGYFVIRLFSLQIIQGAGYLARANDNRTQTISLQTTRGIIYDRNNFILASNAPSYNVVITPALLPDDDGAVQQIYRGLSALIGVPVSNGDTSDKSVKNFTPCATDLGITQIVVIGDTNAPYSPVEIKCNVDEATAMKIQEEGHDWPGVSIEIEPIRQYPTGSLTAEIVGFLGPVPASLEAQYQAQGFVPGRDKVGYAGVENTLQDILGGKNGERQVEVDVAGQVIQDLTTPLQPIPGENVRLTIDTRLQAAAQTALVNEINYWNTYLNNNQMTNGVVIAMNPKTGEILALVSYPTYENNRMARVIPDYYYQQLKNDPNRPLFNNAVSAEHPPGSVFKLAASIGILNEGVVTPDYKVNDPGKITILEKYYANDPGTPRDYVCWIYKDTGGGHGMVDFLHGVAESCDVYFYKVGGGYQEEVPNGGLGIWRLSEYAKALGYNRATGIELPGEASGLIPDPTWKRLNVGENWSTGDTYISTIGQGYVLATPLQVLMSIATIANDGKMMKPTLVKDILDNQGHVIKPFKPEMVWDITQTPLIHVFDENGNQTGEMKTVAPWVVKELQQGLHMVTSDPTGTAYTVFQDAPYTSAGKTGTAEYCDNLAQAQNLCSPGNWPSHAWYIGYAPFDNPEIAVVAFVYHGQEGATVSAPIVRQVMDAYFQLKSMDSTGGQ